MRKVNIKAKRAKQVVPTVPLGNTRLKQVVHPVPIVQGGNLYIMLVPVQVVIIALLVKHQVVLEHRLATIVTMGNILLLLGQVLVPNVPVKRGTSGHFPMVVIIKEILVVVRTPDVTHVMVGWWVKQ